MFSGEDVRLVQEAIKYYWGRSARHVSDESHGVAWKTRSDGDPMPYELSYLSDEELGTKQRDRLLRLSQERGLHSK
jgi:hypothetical protein